MPVSCWMRRSGQPSRPSAITCCRFSSLKTLLTSMEGNPSIVLNVLPISIGRFSAVPHWPVLGVPRGIAANHLEATGIDGCPADHRRSDEPRDRPDVAALSPGVASDRLGAGGP